MSVSQIIHNFDGTAEIRFPYDPVFISNLKSEIPSFGRAWIPEEKVWVIQHPYVDRVLQMMRERFGYVEAYGEPVANGFASSSRNQTSSCRCDKAHRTLMVCQDAPLEVVKAAYRALSKLNHPDAGGDHTKMVALTQAYETVTGGAR